MSKLWNDIQAANRRYAEVLGEEPALSTLWANRFSILTCMEASLDPAKFAGVPECDGHVIRNAGGRATEDAIRSLLLSYKLLDSREWLVIHHTDCDLQAFNDETMGGFLGHGPAPKASPRKHSTLSGERPGQSEGRGVDWLKTSGTPTSVVADVRRIRSHPLVPRDISIYGYIFDVRSGKLQEILEATSVGAARE